MRFLDLYISGFGKFHDTAVSFEDGLNVIYGKNEAGKSTIHTFIRGMLFGIERQRGRAARNDIYSKYEPWENSGTYEGQLRLESDDGTIYRIERSFQKNKKEFTVINETTGREEPDGRAVLQEILGGMSETMYNNTISIGQLKCATDGGMVAELRNYIANPSTGATYGLDGLYAGESFYATTEHIYNRTWVGYDRKFFHDTLHVEAGMVFHYDGTGMGTQQVVQLSVDIQRLFNIGPKRPAHRHGPLH